MTHHRAWLVAVAVVAASAVVGAPAAGAKTATAKAEADLAVTRVKISRSFVVVPPNGKVPEIGVTVSVKNVGHATAPETVTKVELIQNGHELDHKEVQAGRLPAGQATTQIAIFRGVEPALGFLHAIGHADVTLKVAGAFANDIKLSAPTPVIAQRWRAEPIEVEVHLPGPTFGSTEDDLTSGAGTIVFRFSRVAARPARFVYTASGAVHQTATLSGECTGEGEQSVSMNRWGQDSGLFISTSLKEYEATVRASLAKPFTIGTTCTDIPATVPATVRFHDLLTRTGASAAPVPMSPTTHHLTGTATLGTLFTLRYDWDLAADVP
jgi:hypothetical protein